MNNRPVIKSQPPTPAIGVGGILFNQYGQVLLIKRGQPPAEGQWSIPGGRLEAGETLATACEREFAEETGLAVSASHVVAVVERKLEGFHYVIVDFLVILDGADFTAPVAQSDVLEAGWFHLAEFDKLPIVPGLADIIRRAAVQHDTARGLHRSPILAGDFILPG